MYKFLVQGNLLMLHVNPLSTFIKLLKWFKYGIKKLTVTVSWVQIYVQLNKQNKDCFILWYLLYTVHHFNLMALKFGDFQKWPCCQCLILTLPSLSLNNQLKKSAVS